MSVGCYLQIALPANASEALSCSAPALQNSALAPQGAAVSSQPRSLSPACTFNPKPGHLQPPGNTTLHCIPGSAWMPSAKHAHEISCQTLQQTIFGGLRFKAARTPCAAEALKFLKSWPGRWAEL